MTAVSAWIVDPQGRPVPGVDVLITAQGWRGQRWAARSDARGRATFELPPMNARSAGTLTASVPALGVERSGRLGEVLLVTVAGATRPRLPEQAMGRAASAAVSHPQVDRAAWAQAQQPAFPPQPLPRSSHHGQDFELQRANGPDWANILKMCLQPVPAKGQPCRKPPCPACGPGMQCLDGRCCTQESCPKPPTKPGQPCVVARDGCNRRCRGCGKGLTCVNGICCGPGACPATAPGHGTKCSTAKDGCGNPCRQCAPGLSCQAGSCCLSNGYPIGATPPGDCPCGAGRKLHKNSNTCCPEQDAGFGQVPIGQCPCQNGMVQNATGQCCPQNPTVGSQCSLDCPCPAPMTCDNGVCCLVGSSIINTIPYNDFEKKPYNPLGKSDNVWLLDSHALGQGDLAKAFDNGTLGSAQPCGVSGCGSCPPGESCYRVVRHPEGATGITNGWQPGGGDWEASQCTSEKPCLVACMCMGPDGPGKAPC